MQNTLALFSSPEGANLSESQQPGRVQSAGSFQRGTQLFYAVKSFRAQHPHHRESDWVQVRVTLLF